MIGEGWQVALVLLGLFALVQSVAVFALARSVGLLQIAVGHNHEQNPTELLRVGAEAPRILGIDAGTQHNVELERGAFRRWLVVFVTATCSSCRDAIAHARRLSEEARGTATPVVVLRGSVEQGQLVSQLAGHLLVLADSAGTMHEAYHIAEVPFAYVVIDGRVAARGPASTREQLEVLINPRSQSNGIGTPVELAGSATKEANQ